MEALRLTAQFIRRAVADPSDDDARAAMMLAASYAGIGFGNAGVHLPHGMSYAVAGLVKDFRAAGYDAVDHALIPHGVSVIVNAPAVFRYTAQASPDRHLKAAEILGAKVEHACKEDAGKILSECLVCMMRDLRIPNGLKAMGYGISDIPALVEGTLPQHRVTKLSPRPAGPEELGKLFEETMVAF
jgi:hydroxyacid-oxoacid transhydrogenase